MWAARAVGERRRTPFWLVSFALLLSLGSSADAQTATPTPNFCSGNLLSNGSFETHTGASNSIGDPIPTVWVLESGEQGATTAFNPPNGSWVGYVWGIASNNQGRWTQQVSASAGTTYSMTFYSGTHDTSVLPTIEIRFYNSSNAEIGTPAIHTITTDIDVAPSSLGGPYSLSATAPSGVSYLKVIFRDPSSTRAGAKGDSVCLRVATPTPTRTPTNTLTPTRTNTATRTPTNSPTRTATQTATNTITSSPTQTPTNTLTNTPTRTPTNTPTRTSTSTATETVVPTATDTRTETPTTTVTVTHTATRTDTPTATNTAEPTATHTAIPTASATQTETATAVPTQTPTGVPTDTATPVWTDTATATYTATSTETAEPAATDTPTVVPTLTDSPTPVPTDTASPSPLPTNTPTTGPSLTPSSTATNSPSSTPSVTATATVTATPTDVPICPPVPNPACKVGESSRPMRIRIRPDKNKIIWKWRTNTGSGLKSDFGDPLNTSSYALCIYADGIIPLVGEYDAPAGGTCAGKPCWKNKPKGFKYRDKDTTPHGIRKILLRVTQGPLADIIVVGRGPVLQPPALPLPSTGPVTVQLLKSNGTECWQNVFSPPFKKNFTDRFADKSDP